MKLDPSRLTATDVEPQTNGLLFNFSKDRDHFLLAKQHPNIHVGFVSICLLFKLPDTEGHLKVLATINFFYPEAHV